MCSKPQEFADKKTGEIYTVACRSCDQCIATRRHGWVARAMAEKTDLLHTLCLALTYSDNTQQSRDGAFMFAYADVRDFLKRVRSAAARQAKSTKSNIVPQIRFLCAGEQGDRFGRCHWHLIIYSDVDITKLGKFLLRGSHLTEKSDMLTVGKRKRRLNWSIWPHGFVTLQEPDQGGMNYVLSYCLKDQFTVEKSQGSMREAKAENFATGLFRMSKRPAIGESFLMRKMEALDASGSVLPALKITIPDFHGYWQPSGSFRKKLLWCLVALNKRALWATGANAPQWSSLLASCQEIDSDMEILNGLPKKQLEIEQFKQIEADLEFRSRQEAGRKTSRDFARKCANNLPCRDCLHELTDKQLAFYRLEKRPDENGVWEYVTPEGTYPETFPVGKVNQHCLSRGSKIARLTAPVSGL